MSAQVLNFAQAGSMCGDLAAQAQRAMLSPQVPKAPGGGFRSETLVVVHTCGNDFIMKMAQVLMGGGLLGGLLGGGMPAGGGQNVENLEILRANPGAREAAMLAQFLELMHRGGARHYLVSGVPAFIDMPIFNILLPVIGQLIEQNKLADLGVGPGDPPSLAMQVQAASLHERWSELVEEFQKGHADSSCAFFDEVGALERLRANYGAAVFDRSMWDFSMFHPTIWGHEQLAVEAHRCALEQISALTPKPKEEPKKEEPKPIKVQVRNVKGDVTFAVDADAGWRMARLREAVIASAPDGFAVNGATCVLALKGKFLSDGTETLAELGVADSSQLIAVMKAAGPKSPSNSA